MIKTYEDQIREHIAFLRSNKLDVTGLQVRDAGKSKDFVRCRAIGETSGRGEYCYQTIASVLNNGSYGLSTICRSPGGERSAPFRTYGQHPSGSCINSQVNCASFATPEAKKTGNQEARSSEETVRKCRYIWGTAAEDGKSDYLERKGVGAYGIRFLENAYGRVAVVPARDQGGSLLALEFLNPDGKKRFLKGSSWKGLFHMLTSPTNGQPIGIAEGYVTAATCFELAGIPTVCAFNAENLPAVAKSIHEMFPNSPIIIFADNDRHLKAIGSQNKGVLKAREAQVVVGLCVSLAIPEFCDCRPFKEASDWNDLVRLKGAAVARAQIIETVRKMMNNPTLNL